MSDYSVSDYEVAEQEASWFDITVAGKQFNIASRHGEPHIREVERLLNETFTEVNARVEAQSLLNIAFLTALNLADQLLSRDSAREGEAEEWSRRVETLVARLGTVLEGNVADDQAPPL